jgi:hypothetical protein
VPTNNYSHRFGSYLPPNGITNVTRTQTINLGFVGSGVTVLRTVSLGSEYGNRRIALMTQVDYSSSSVGATTYSDVMLEIDGEFYEFTKYSSKANGDRLEPNVDAWGEWELFISKDFIPFGTSGTIRYRCGSSTAISAENASVFALTGFTDQVDIYTDTDSEVSVPSIQANNGVFVWTKPDAQVGYVVNSRVSGVDTPISDPITNNPVYNLGNVVVHGWYKNTSSIVYPADFYHNLPATSWDNVIAIKPRIDTSSTAELSNLVFSTSDYFTNYVSRDAINLLSTGQTNIWPGNTYPTSRISSVNYNRVLNRWFLGGQSLESEAQIFLHAYNNGDIDTFYISGNNADIYTGADENFALQCGPTKIYSVGNSVIISNGYHVLTYVTTDTFTSELYYDFKRLAFTCDQDVATGVCGINWSNVPSSLTKLYEHLTTIVSYGADTNSPQLRLLSNTVSNNDLTINGSDYSCIGNGLTSSDKGYYLQSYNFGYTVSTIASDLGQTQSHVQIKIQFTRNVSIDLLNDVTLLQNARSVGRGGGANWDISGTGSTYIISASDTIYNGMINNQSPDGYTLVFDFSAMGDASIPNVVQIPLYQANLGFSVNNNYLEDIRSNRTDSPAFVVNHNSTSLIEYYVKSNSSCGCGYVYNIKSPVSTTDFTLCLSDVAGLYNDSEIKCILTRGSYIYYFVQQDRDPISPSGHAVYRYNLYRANIATPNNLMLMLDNLPVIRHFGDVNRDITNKWNNTSFIDENYIVIGIPNTNMLFRIDYGTL